MTRPLAPLAAAFSPTARVQRMLDVEAALAGAEARASVIPAAAAAAIAAAARVERYDVAALRQQAAVAGTPVIPLVKALTDQVDDSTRGYVHWGATSQDIVDTAMILQVRDGLDLLTVLLHDIGDRCATLADAHRWTPMAGRTLLQQALPITFGLKAARWLAAATRRTVRLHGLRATLVVQLGGAAGTLASLGEHGPAVAAHLADELGLDAPDLPWQAERDRVAEVVAGVGITAATVAGIAGDIVLLAQTEVGEVGERVAPGKVTSSALPHKRNAVDAVAALAAARHAGGAAATVLMAPPHEHERAAGAWQAEWDAVTDVFLRAGEVLVHVDACLAGLEVYPERMAANLDLTGGQVMAESLTAALAPTLGRDEAYRVIRAACDRARSRDQHLRAIAGDDPQITAALTTDQIEGALDPLGYLGSSDELITRALDGWRNLRS